MKNNKALKVLFLYNGIFVFGGSILGPLYSLYAEGITQSVAAVSILWATYMFVATIGSLIVASFGDTIKEKEYLLLAGYLLRAFGWFMFLIAGNFYSLLVVQVVLGLGEAVGTPAFEVMVAEHIDKNKHVKEYSLWKVLSNVLVAAGAILGGYLATKFGFTSLFYVMGTLALISFFGVLLKPRRLL
ncbi:MAG: MFS transporter [Patescibacteria group bacterium]